MEVTLIPQGNRTTVAIRFENIPLGVDPRGNEAGTESLLDKLVSYAEKKMKQNLRK